MSGQDSSLITEEKDVSKLQIQEVKSAIAIPILDKQTGSPQAVMLVYNYDKDSLQMTHKQDQADGGSRQMLWDVSNLASSIMFNVQNLQGILANSDVLEAQFDLVNEGIIFLGAEQAITKLNKSAEIMLNTTSQVAVGKKISEAFGTVNSHLIETLTKVTGQNPQAQMLKTQIVTNQGSGTDNSQGGMLTIPINFHVNKLADAQKKTHSYCLILQPIIRSPQN